MLCWQVVEALERVDGILGQLMTGLIERNLLHCVNIMIVSDHGETTADCKRLLIWLRLKHATSWMLNVSLVLSLFLYELWNESGGKFSTAQWEFLSFPCCTSGCKQTCHVLAISLWFCRSKTDQHFRACVLLREALEAKSRIQIFILVESLHLLQETTTPYMLKKYSIKSETVG